MLKIIGTDDSVNTCDCCGKTNLKSTVVVDVDGEVLYYGSVCATRHTGLDAAEIKSAIRNRVDVLKIAARKEYESSAAHLSLQVKQSQAQRAGLIGKPFAEFCATERANDRAVFAEVRAKFGGIDF